MTDITLFPCQDRAKTEIVNDITTHLSKNDFSNSRKYGLQSPTGSGKTVILTKIIQDIAKHYDNKVAFIWLTIGRGQLASQSKTRLTNALTDLTIISASDVVLSKTLAGSIVVLNWDALNKTNEDDKPINIATRGEVNFQTVCENTRKDNIPIILIIDEAHLYANTEKSFLIRNSFIKPTYTLEASATPRTKKWHGSSVITTKEVSDCGLIKNDIKQDVFSDSDEGIRVGAKKLQQIIKLAQETNAGYNPRMLVFIPNANHADNIELREVLAILDEFGWNEASGEVVIWMSDRKSKDYEKCKDNNSNCKVIITKEAIDTGVDIPAIQVIVQLRPAGNKRTELQKLGRGLRMPLQKHYGNDLDKLFFYVFDDYEVDETDAEYIMDLLENKFKFVKDLRAFSSKVELAAEDVAIKAKEASGKAFKKVMGFFKKDAA